MGIYRLRYVALNVLKSRQSIKVDPDLQLLLPD